MHQCITTISEQRTLSDCHFQRGRMFFRVSSLKPRQEGRPSPSPSRCHIVTSSHRHAVTAPHRHAITPSHHHTVTPSRRHIVTPSHRHTDEFIFNVTFQRQKQQQHCQTGRELPTLTPNKTVEALIIVTVTSCYCQHADP